MHIEVQYIVSVQWLLAAIVINNKSSLNTIFRQIH